jgi:PAS domain S-box-containing protein
MSFASEAAHAMRRGRRLIALSYLIAATVVVAVLPVAGLALYATYEVSESHRAETEGRLLDAARSLASDFDSELQVRVTTARLLADGRVLDYLAAGDGVDRQEIARVAGHFATTLKDTAIGVWRLGSAGPAVVAAVSDTTDRPISLTDVPQIERAIEHAVADRQLRLSALFRLSPSTTPMIAVAYPVVRDGVVAGAVAVTLPVDTVQQVVRAHPVPDRGVAVVTDSALRVVARVPERFIGERTTEDYQQAVTSASSGIFRATTLDGVRTVAAFTSLRIAPGYRVTIGAPVDSLERGWTSFRNALVVGGIAAFGVLVVAVLFGTRVWNAARGLLSDQDAYLTMALDKSGLATWESDRITGQTVWSPAHFDLLGYPRHPSGTATAKMWWDAVHPDDVAQVREQWRKGEEHPEGLLRLTYRIIRRDTGEVRWFETMGRFVDRERLIGVIVDMTDTKREEEQRLLLAREVDHRSKNLLAVVQAMLAMTQATDVEGLRTSLSQRIRSLANTHSLLAQNLWVGATMREVAESELASYGNAVFLDGPPVPIRAEAVQPLAMALHELATNAAKYGALSAEGGQVSARWHTDAGHLVLRWVERGGPAVSEPTTRGFGSRMLARVLSQMGGTIESTWDPAGLTATIRLPLARAGR